MAVKVCGERNVSCGRLLQVVHIIVDFFFGTTGLHFLCVGIGRLAMLSDFSDLDFSGSGSSCMCLVFFDWLALGACFCC